MKISKKIIVLFLMVFATALIFSFGVGAKAKYTLKFAGISPPDHPGTQAQFTIAEEVKEATNGEVEITVYPANQLGDYVQVYEDIMRGNIDMGYLVITGQYNPMFDISGLPYLTTKWEDIKKVFAPGSFWYKTFEDANEELDVKLLGIFVDGFVSIATTKEVNEPFNIDANHNVLIRVFPMETGRLTMADLNYDTVTINWSDLYTSMQTGICDGWIGGSASVNYLSFRDILNYFYPTKTFMDILGYVINKNSLEQLPKEYQEIIYEACQKQGLISIENAQEKEATYQKKLNEEYGVKIIEPSQEELDAMASHIRNVTWPKFEKLFGKDVIEGILSDIK